MYSDWREAVLANKFGKFPVVVGLPIVCVYELCPVPTAKLATADSRGGHSETLVLTFVFFGRLSEFVYEAKLFRSFRENLVFRDKDTRA